MIELFEVAGRTSKNEITARMWKLKNGYKMSQKAVDMLELTKDNNKLVFGKNSDTGNLVVKCEIDGDYHCKMSMDTRTITNAGVLKNLVGFGESFELSTTPDADGFYEMTSTTTNQEETNQEEENTDTDNQEVELEATNSMEEVEVEFETEEEFG